MRDVTNPGELIDGFCNSRFGQALSGCISEGGLRPWAISNGPAKLLDIGLCQLLYSPRMMRKEAILRIRANAALRELRTRVLRRERLRGL